jgi:hypothetical protein
MAAYYVNARFSDGLSLDESLLLHEKTTKVLKKSILCNDSKLIEIWQSIGLMSNNMTDHFGCSFILSKVSSTST